MYPSFNTLRKNLVFANSGDTSTAYKFTAGTISATTYLNLPATPPPNLTPITLDAANLRVGIDTPTPQYTLDVNGDGHFMGTVTADTELVSQEITVAKATVDNQLLLPNIPSATKTKVLYYDTTSHGVSFGDAPVSPPPSVLPLTLDTTNNRVGVNVTVPEEALDVDGNIQATGDLVVDGLLYFQGMPDVVTDKVLYFDTTTKKVSFGTAPVSDVLPITLDKANNRVGINRVTPTQALDVSGNIKASNSYVSDAGIVLLGPSTYTTIRALTGSPEGVVTAEVGSLFLRKDGSAGTTLYTKVSGTSNTGWQAVGGTPTTTWVYTLASNLSTPAGTVVPVFTITMPYIGIYEVVLTLKLTSGSASYSSAVSTLNNSVTFSFPDTTTQGLGPVSNTYQIVQNYLYKAAAAGTRYVNVSTSTTSLSLQGGQCLCTVTFKG
jgi:hypothetical protein